MKMMKKVMVLAVLLSAGLSIKAHALVSCMLDFQNWSEANNRYLQLRTECNSYATCQYAYGYRQLAQMYYQQGVNDGCWTGGDY